VSDDANTLFLYLNGYGLTKYSSVHQPHKNIGTFDEFPHNNIGTIEHNSHKIIGTFDNEIPLPDLSEREGDVCSLLDGQEILIWQSSLFRC
jgi:hypothetical protein